MSTVDKMLVKGIRGFDPENKHVITFFRPLTPIVDPNGIGKTTIIECLKLACTAELPPHSRSGHSFIHDPKIASETETNAQIKLWFKTATGKDVACVRSFQLMQKAFKMEFKVLESMLQSINPHTEEVIIVEKKNNTLATQERCIIRLILYHLCVNLLVIVISYSAFRYMCLKSTFPLPHWGIIASKIIFYSIIEDFVFYWGHRILHTKWLYKHVHSVHHEYATPFGLTSEYAHLAKIMFLGFATIIGPALTGPHLFALWLWMTLRVLETVKAHSDYHFPWNLSNFLPFYGGADFHDYHHCVLYTKSGNYASTLPSWIGYTEPIEITGSRNHFRVMAKRREG